MSSFPWRYILVLFYTVATFIFFTALGSSDTVTVPATRDASVEECTRKGNLRVCEVLYRGCILTQDGAAVPHDVTYNIIQDDIVLGFILITSVFEAAMLHDENSHVFSAIICILYIITSGMTAAIISVWTTVYIPNIKNIHTALSYVSQDPAETPAAVPSCAHVPMPRPSIYDQVTRMKIAQGCVIFIILIPLVVMLLRILTWRRSKRETEYHNLEAAVETELTEESSQ